MDSLQILGGAGVILITALLVTIGKLIQIKASQKRFLRARQEFMLEILNEALHSRARFDIKFAEAIEQGPVRYMRGPCIDITNGSLIIDTGLTYALKSWIDQKVHVYFQIARGRTSSCYDFVTTIQSIPNSSAGYALEIRIPEELSNNQKRTFVRLAPTWRMVREFHLWLSLPSTGLSTCPKDLQLPAYSNPYVAVDDISGGGARLLITHVGQEFSMATDQGLLMFAEMQSYTGQNTLALWFIGSVVNVSEISADVHTMGIRFRAWAQDSDPALPLTWFPVDSQGGVPPLASWVMLRHLETSRSLLAEDKAAND